MVGAWTEGLEGPPLMMTQEEYMDMLAMRGQGMSYVENGE